MLLRQKMDLPQKQTCSVVLISVLEDDQYKLLVSKHVLQLEFLETTYQAAVKQVKELHIKELMCLRDTIRA
jgi:hypothetical protein